jgi:hypothetical protein
MKTAIAPDPRDAKAAFWPDVREMALARFKASAWAPRNADFGKRVDWSVFGLEGREGAGNPIDYGLSPGLSAIRPKLSDLPPWASDLLREWIGKNADDRLAMFALSQADEPFLLDAGTGDHSVEAPLKGLSVPLIFLRVAQGKNAALMLHLRAEAGAFSMPIVLARVEASSSLSLGLAMESSGGVLASIQVFSDSSADSNLSVFQKFDGFTTLRSVSRLRLLSGGATANVGAAWSCRDGQTADMAVFQDHESPNAKSRALYKGLAASGGRSVFQGLITVNPGASGTDAYLANRNLLLDGNSRAESLPQLKIANGDVRCSHGSTTGRIDEEQLFYLMSRGFSRDEAMSILSAAFLDGAFSDAPDSIKASLAGTG